jgi:hypothetical protein
LALNLEAVLTKLEGKDRFINRFQETRTESRVNLLSAIHNYFGNFILGHPKTSLTLRRKERKEFPVSIHLEIEQKNTQHTITNLKIFILANLATLRDIFLSPRRKERKGLFCIKALKISTF